MTRIFRHTLLFVTETVFLGGFLGAFLLIAIPAFGQSESDPPAEWSPWTMTAAEIHTTGAVRLSELFRMMPAVETWSADRYTLRFLGTGLAGQHPASPAVYLDGVALPSLFLDRVLTESLPLSPGDASSWSWRPGMHVTSAGRWAEGRLNVTTPMLSGWEVRGAIAVINETGDPGPAKHSDARLNNVDRSGPATWLRVGWGNTTWMIQSGLQTDLHHLTDERISGRVRRTYSETAQPVITQFSPFIRVRYEGLRWRGHLLTAHSRRKDFIFHEAAGWEWPARLERSSVIGHLEGDLDRIHLGMTVDASRMDTGNRPSFITLPTGISMQEASVGVSVSTEWAGLAWSGGIGLRTSGVSQQGVSLTRVMPSARFSMARNGHSWSSLLSASLLQIPAEGQQKATISSLAEWTLSHRGPSGGVELETRFARGHFPEPGQLTEWAAARLNLGSWMTLPWLEAWNTTPRSVGFGLTGYRKLTPAWTGWLEGRLRWMDGQILPDRTIEQRFGVGPMLPAWAWSAPHSGWLFSRTIGIERPGSDGPTIRAFLQFHHVSSEGDDVFFRHQTGFPRHRVWFTASDERAGGVSWMTRIGYLSAWTWPEYQESVSASIPADIVVDATIGKTLFSGHVRSLVSLLNIPDRALGNHPAGVREQLAIRLTLSFSSRSFQAKPES